jgi:hypothetical protein
MPPKEAIPMNDAREKSASMPSAFFPVPTTKILAIGHFPVPLTAEQRKALGHNEVSETVRMYLAGKIDQWWYRQDGLGVVFLLNVTSVNDAKELAESLPFGHAELLKFDLMALAPLAPLQVLLREASKTSEGREEK